MRETVQPHTRLLRCSLEVDDSRAYWQRTAELASRPSGVEPGAPSSAQRAFEEYWFGARSLGTVRLLLANFRARFDAFPPALQVLQRWTAADPAERRVICHWHLQLSDPLYRAFSGEFLVARRDHLRPQVRSEAALAWVTTHVTAQWTTNTRIHYASKLLSAAYAAGLLSSSRDPRPLASPPVSDAALTYMLYLLREVDFAGTLLDNAYFASVDLCGPDLDHRLRGLTALRFRRQADLVDFGWVYPSLAAWAAEHLFPAPAARLGGLA